MDEQSLEVLADQANFAHANKIRVSSRKNLSDYFIPISQGTILARFTGVGRTDRPFDDMEVVIFTDPNDYTTARMYYIGGEIIEDGYRSPINLSEELKPTASGKDVAVILNYYAKAQSNE